MTESEIRPKLPNRSRSHWFSTFLHQLGFTGSSQRFAFAKSSVRREAKAILFQELAIAIRHGMPLDEALRNCMQTEGSVHGHPDDNNALGDRLVALGINILYFVLLITGGFFIMLLVSNWAADVERVARIMATRLLPYIEQGHSLADAMAKLPIDFSREENETIRAGENWGNLADALDNVGKFQFFERELQRHWARMVYPIWMIIVLVAIVQFMLSFIVVKFKDIYDQMGSQLPGPTQFLVDTGSYLGNAGVGLVLVVLIVTFWVLTLRMFMVGSRFIRNVATFLAIAVVTSAGLTFLFSLKEQNVVELSTTSLIIGTMLIIGFGIFVGLQILKFLESLVINIEQWAGDTFQSIPVVGAPLRAEQESRWLAAVSTGLSSHVSAADAVEAAGRICRASMGRTSNYAASLIRQGYPLGYAVKEARVLRMQTGHRLRLLDDRPDFLKGLLDISEDASRESLHTLNRATRISEVLGVTIIGFLISLFTISLYLPLFNIVNLIPIGY